MGGVLGAFRRRTPIKVLFAGLDAAGKTTILNKLKLGPDSSAVMTTMPTLSFNAAVLDHRRAQFGMWDVGGQDNLRPFWRHHYTGTQAVVYVVDANDEDRIAQSGDELHAMLADRELRFACVLVLANKADLPYAVSDAMLRRQMRLDQLPPGLDWRLIRTCARTGAGLSEALDWLHAHSKPL